MLEKMLKPFQYHHSVTRDVFVSNFLSIFSTEEYEELLQLCQATTRLESFLLYYDDEDYYIIDLCNGYMINWYKHLGRCLFISIENLTTDTLVAILTDLHNEFINEKEYRK